MNPHLATAYSNEKGKLLKDICLKPSQTFRFILQEHPKQYINLLFVLGGIMNAMDHGVDRLAEDGRIDTLLISIVLGAAFGWISYYLVAYFLSIAGDWLKGKAEPSRYRTVIAWSLVPSLAGAILYIPRIFIAKEAFALDELSGGYLQYLDAFLNLIQFMLGLWTLVILIKGIKLIQDFSTGRAVWNLVLPVMVVFGVIFLFVLIFQLGEVQFF